MDAVSGPGIFSKGFDHGSQDEVVLYLAAQYAPITHTYSRAPLETTRSMRSRGGGEGPV